VTVLGLMLLLGMVINQASFLTGLHLTTSTNSAILNTLIPVFTLLVVTIRGQERMGGRRLLGFLCALHALMSVRTPQGTIAWFVSLNTFPSLAVPARVPVQQTRF